MKKALLIAPVHQVIIDELNDLGYECNVVTTINKEEALKVISQYHGLITSNKLFVDQELIDAGVQLEWIGRMGSGMEIIDVPYANNKGIVCVSSPEGNANAVAEQALGMLLALKHNIVKSHLELQNNIWDRDGNRGNEIFGQTVGIIGYGNNGSLLAQKLAALGMEVLAYDPYKSGFSNTHIQEVNSLQAIYNKANIISFHVPLKEETINYFNDDFLDQMQHPFTIINLSRGNVVNLNTVHRGLQTGKIKGAALDVWPEEPITAAEATHHKIFTELMKLPNFIGTTHIGGYSHEATYKMSYYVAEKLKKIFKNL